MFYKASYGDTVFQRAGQLREFYDRKFRHAVLKGTKHRYYRALHPYHRRWGDRCISCVFLNLVPGATMSGRWTPVKLSWNRMSVNQSILSCLPLLKYWHVQNMQEGQEYHLHCSFWPLPGSLGSTFLNHPFPACLVWGISHVTGPKLYDSLSTCDVELRMPQVLLSLTNAISQIWTSRRK